MPTNLYKDLNFLNRYFTSMEFNFINNASIGDQTIDNLIDKETKMIFLLFLKKLWIY